MKPSIPKGTRDFTPEQVIRRNYIFETIRKVFVKCGYQPIETPAMENLATLTGKYGDEGDALLFKVLNNGDFLAKADEAALENRDSNQLIPSISKRGLRYDLTVPFARFVVMHQHEIALPFKRYAIYPVWRADRPQKGRYQEFYQCDVDVVGSNSLMYEAELIQIYDEVFSNLNLKVVQKVSNRKVLAGIAEVALGSAEDRFSEMTVAIDKLDKIGFDGVEKELAQRGITKEAIDTIKDILKIKSLENLKPHLKESEVGMQGIAELESVFQYLETAALNNQLQFDVTLARGLNYYTGCIFEVAVDTQAHPAIQMGSVGGGGRYDDLTGIFGMKNISGVGISFGAERIYDVMEKLELFPKSNSENLRVLFIAFDNTTHQYAFEQLIKLRKAAVNADLYPDPVKLKKQMKYANDRKVPFVILVGEEEMKSGKLTLKNMESGKQEMLDLSEIATKVAAP